jgi:hypothetical protein
MAHIITLEINEDLKKMPVHGRNLSYFANRFVIYDDYEIVTEGEDVWGNPEVYIRATNTEFKEYKHEDYAGHLYSEIAKIHLDHKIKVIPDIVNGKETENKIETFGIESEKAKQSLIRFCKRFGLLGIYERKYFNTLISEKDFTEGQKITYKNDFQEEQINNDIINQIYRMKIVTRHIEKWAIKKITEEDKAELFNIVNAETPLFYERLIPDGDKSYPTLIFASLLDFAWWQLRQALLGDVTYKRCNNERCGNVFAVTHGKQKFCPPYPKSKISACQNSYKRRKQYQKLKER